MSNPGTFGGEAGRSVSWIFFAPSSSRSRSRSDRSNLFADDQRCEHIRYGRKKRLLVWVRQVAFLQVESKHPQYAFAGDDRNAVVAVRKHAWILRFVVCVNTIREEESRDACRPAAQAPSQGQATATDHQLRRKPLLASEDQFIHDFVEDEYRAFGLQGEPGNREQRKKNTFKLFVQGNGFERGS